MEPVTRYVSPEGLGVVGMKGFRLSEGLDIARMRRSRAVNPSLFNALTCAPCSRSVLETSLRAICSALENFLLVPPRDSLGLCGMSTFASCPCFRKTSTTLETLLQKPWG